jgi:Domain of unknown function (DUF4190)
VTTSPSGEPQTVTPSGYRRTSGLAIASLVCGIAGLLLIAPLLGGIAAVILGKNAQKEIAANPDLDGESYASAGIVLGWVGIAFAVVGFLVFLLALATFASGSGSPVIGP